MSWSNKQLHVRDVILHRDDIRTIVLVGPVQSGKTYAATFSFLYWAYSRFTGQDFILAGPSRRQLLGSVMKCAEDFSHAVNGGWKARQDFYTLRAHAGGINRFYPLLGGSKGTEGRARSFSAQGALVDEATLVDTDFLNSVSDRLSKPGAKLVLAMNPSGPQHPLKKKYVDVADEDDGIEHIPFEIADNIHLETAYVRDLHRRYSGAQFKRMVQGQWAQTEGAVYPHIMEAVSAHPLDIEPVDYMIGLDIAESTGTHHAVEVGLMSDGTLWALREWVWNGKDKGELAVPTAVDKLIHWMGRKTYKFIAVDDSKLGWIKQFRRRGYPAVYAQKSVQDGISVVKDLSENGRLWVSRRCPTLVEQLSNYRWDERAGLLGLDKPVKVDDHGPDALRYAIYGSTRARRKPRVL